MNENGEDFQIKLARKYLKMKILEDDLSFHGHEQQKMHVRDLLSRTVEAGESNSALIIGPRGSGKTTLVNSVLHTLKQRPSFHEDSIVVQLNGLLHTDDKLALKAITTQMSLENAIGDRVFGSFSENLAFLLSCLKSGKDRHCKSVLFFLDEFDMFCHPHGSQTLLYNLFDIAQSRQAPICVLGITCRLDVIELLEKRVKSRFSHRQIFIFPNSGDSEEKPFDTRMKLFRSLLSLPCEITRPKNIKNRVDSDNLSNSESEITERRRKSTRKNSLVNTPTKSANDHKNMTKSRNVKNSESDLENEMSDSSEMGEEKLHAFETSPHILSKCGSSWKEFSNLDPIFVSFWNENIVSICEDSTVLAIAERLYDLDVSEQTFRNILFQLVCKLSSAHPQLEVSDVTQACQSALNVDDKLLVLLSLSILELSLVIAMKHQTEIFDNQPMNFQMVLNRYTKFANCNSSSQSVPRAVILKAFEHLRAMELIAPVRGDSQGLRLQREHQMHRLLATGGQVLAAVQQYRALPTELAQWASSEIV